MLPEQIWQQQLAFQQNQQQSDFQRFQYGKNLSPHFFPPPPSQDQYFSSQPPSQKELGFLECRELEFLMIDPDTVPPHKAAFI
ncbi:hypothetical protein OROGR_014472 [Orobanche gracilis]